MSKKVCTFASDFEREKTGFRRYQSGFLIINSGSKCPGGGMVDAVDSKSAVSNGVGVQVPPGVQKVVGRSLFFVLYPLPLSMSIGNVLLTFAAVHINIGCCLGCSNTG